MARSCRAEEFVVSGRGWVARRPGEPPRRGRCLCLAIRDRSEIRFQALTRGTERLRQELDSLEALDPRGVPTDAYDAYIGRVEDYNESIPEWERQTGGAEGLGVAM